MPNLRETLAQQVREIPCPDAYAYLLPSSGKECMHGGTWFAALKVAASLIASSPQLAELMEENEGLRKALREIVDAQLIPGLYHGGETYYGLNQRIKALATAAIDAAKGAGG